MIGRDDFRHVLGHFASGVTIVTTYDEDGQPVGLTASAFTSLSLDPPLILVCVDQNARCYGALARCERFAVNILATHQESVSRRFASSVDDKFDGLRLERGKVETPLIADALAHIECEKVAAYPGGDHTIFVGRVEASRVGPGEPLLHYRGLYDRLHSSLERTGGTP